MISAALCSVHDGTVVINVYGYVALMLIETVAVVGGGCREQEEDLREESWLLYLGMLSMVNSPVCEFPAAMNYRAMNDTQ